MDWLWVLAKHWVAPRFSVNSRCSKQLLLRQTQLFSFVKLQVLLFVKLQLFFSVNSRCSKQLLLHWTQLFSFVELQVFLFMKLQLFLFLWTQGVLSNWFYYIELNWSYWSNFKCSCLLNFNSSYCCEVQVFLFVKLQLFSFSEPQRLLCQTKTTYLRRCILYQESTLLCQLWTLHYSATLKYRCSY